MQVFRSFNVAICSCFIVGISQDMADGEPTEITRKKQDTNKRGSLPLQQDLVGISLPPEVCPLTGAT